MNDDRGYRHCLIFMKHERSLFLSKNEISQLMFWFRSHVNENIIGGRAVMLYKNHTGFYHMVIKKIVSGHLFEEQISFTMIKVCSLSVMAPTGGCTSRIITSIIIKGKERSTCDFLYMYFPTIYFWVTELAGINVARL